MNRRKPVEVGKTVWMMWNDLQKKVAVATELISFPGASALSLKRIGGRGGGGERERGVGRRVSERRTMQGLRKAPVGCLIQTGRACGVIPTAGGVEELTRSGHDGEFHGHR